MTSSSELEVKPGDLIAGKYRVDRVLGEGGMGVVVAATHQVLGEQVALKFLLPGLQVDEKTSERFLREARAAAKIKSPHVARVVDVGTMAESGSPYIVMELMSGHDLGVELQEAGALEIEQACSFTIQACEALASAHQAGVIHRDIKPGNLFLTQDADGSPLVKVLDFGISKLDSMDAAALTQTQTAMGSPLYMSPEQMRSARQVDHRTDIWSLGIVLYELLTGQMPYMAETMPQLCALVLEAEPPKIRSIVPEVPDSLSAVIERCLSKEPQNRFATMAELALALAPFAGEAGEREALRVSRILGVKGQGSLSDEEPAPGSLRPVPPSMDSQAARARTQAVATDGGVNSTLVSQEVPQGSFIDQGTGISFGRTEHNLPVSASKGSSLRFGLAAVIILGAGFGLYAWRQADDSQSVTGVAAQSKSGTPSSAAAQPLAPAVNPAEQKATEQKAAEQKAIEAKLRSQQAAELESKEAEKLAAEQAKKEKRAEKSTQAPRKTPAKRPRRVAPKAAPAPKKENDDSVFGDRL